MLALSQCSPQCQRAMTFACRRPIQLCARVSSASSRQFALCARRIQYPDRFVQHRLSSLNQWTRKMATEASSSAQNVAAKHHQGLARRLWEKYNMWLDKQPLLTKMGTSIVLATTGDLICQLAFEDKAYSFRRSVEIMTLGAFLIGPAFHYWYTFLAQFIPGNSWASIFKRLAMDQILFGPTFIAAVFAYMATIQGKSEEAAERIQLYWPQAVVANWKLWVPAQVCLLRKNHLLVPTCPILSFASAVRCTSLCSFSTFQSFQSNTKYFMQISFR